MAMGFPSNSQRLAILDNPAPLSEKMMVTSDAP
jgi:hypothetical protein